MRAVGAVETVDAVSRARSALRPVNPAPAAVAMIARREIVRFSRQPARVAAAIGTPILLWVLMASGFATSLGAASLDVSYAAFLLPGAMTLIAVFSAVFSSISVIEDRREGWLQAVLVSPAPRWSIALGKIIGGGTVAWAQGAVLLLALPMLDVPFTIIGTLIALLGLGLVSFAMAGLGLAFAWRCESVSSFHAVMNLLFAPMWLLSGAFFPIEGAAGWMQWLVFINPLTWATEAIRGPLLGEGTSPPGAALLGEWGPQWGLGLLVSAIFAAAMLIAATLTIARRRK